MIEENLDRSRTAVDARDADAYARLVHAFHDLIVRGADNTRPTAHNRQLMKQPAYRLLVAGSLRRPGRLRVLLAGHRLGVDRIREKDRRPRSAVGDFARSRTRYRAGREAGRVGP
ncbi:FCD domain-containing protein [Nocardiopsis sediminis]|uniref:FCD domain-containing protein n=1 Tax=Nocardiopsis sediminis TaxID=1778267 RepID=A0ABV8FN20_9ACTN